MKYIEDKWREKKYMCNFYIFLEICIFKTKYKFQLVK